MLPQMMFTNSRTVSTSTSLGSDEMSSSRIMVLAMASRMSADTDSTKKQGASPVMRMATTVSLGSIPSTTELWSSLKVRLVTRLNMLQARSAYSSQRSLLGTFGTVGPGGSFGV